MEIKPIKHSKLIKHNKLIMKIQSLKGIFFVKASLISISIFLILFFGISMFFSTHFYFDTTINNINAFGKTVKELDELLLLKSKSYTLELVERNGVKEQIGSTDIELKYNAKDKIQELKNNQHSLKWINSLFNQKTYEIDDIVTYNEKLLKEHFDKLSCFDTANIVEPQNANFEYNGAGYVIVNEIMGTKVNSDTLYTNVVNAILRGEPTINLEDKNHYINPKYTSISKKIIDTKLLLNKYISSELTYTFTGGKEIIDASLVNTWITVNENLEVSFDEEKMKSHLSKLNDNYDTYGNQREFSTSLGTTINTNGGNYGWLVNRKGEVADLILSIKDGQPVEKEPRYIQTAMTHAINDIGNTYVEINMTKQHLWFYKDSALIAEGPVVTGNVSKNYGTPKGVYILAYKARNATLKGENYSTNVKVFMPFNGGIGIHDASFRSSFGGDIYLKKGSHGCVNAPPALAQKIFNNIDERTPVVCY
ncbi:peptidoglycan binding domain-containing protein [Clostridium sp.]|jgi:lipoprotein-anchoring transpeptidase ErfK/SrfK|uniref:L,D-transpeptidase family protein n=1 Tax=Clostridium sp. TaxID=1506 RepID=UPI003EEEE3B6